MLKSRLTRIVLALALLASLVTIFLSYRSRSDRGPASGSDSALLAPGVTRESTDFEYTQFRDGKAVFQVQAATSILTRDGEHHLETVRLERFGPEGSVTDIIEGKAAEYRVDSSRIEVDRDVVMQLSDGTRIYADSAEADLARELVTIPGSFRFEQGDLEGVGGDLLYQISERLLRIEDRLSVRFIYPGGEGSSSSGKAVYDLEKGVVRLWDGSEIRAGDRSLRAAQIRLRLDERRRIAEIVADNDSLLRSPLGDFSGDRILLRLPDEEGPARIAVLERQAETSSQRLSPARFERGPAGGSQLLSASRIDGELDEDAAGNSILRTLAASGAVSLSAPEFDIERAESDHFRAEFGAQERISTLILAGGVEMVRQVRAADGLEQERLEAPRVQLDFDEGGRLDLSRAEGPAVLSQTAPDRDRHLTSQGGMSLDYASGSLQSVVAQDSCVLESLQGDEEITVLAPRVAADFSDPDLQKIEAGTGVEITYQVEGRRRRSQSRQLQLEYRSGRLIEAFQRGEVRLWESDPDGGFELSSEEAVYRPLTGFLEASGVDRQPVLKSGGEGRGSFRAIADRFLISPQGSSLSGVGSVQAVLRDPSGEERAVTAERMEAEPNGGWISFRGNPRLIQGENLIEADFLRIHRESRLLQAEGGVESFFRDPDEEDRVYEVAAEQLDLDPGGVARYAGEVVLTSPGLRLQAPELKIYFASEEAGVGRIEAEGGVRIEEKGRHWNADRAIYYADQDRVVVSR